MNEQTVWTYWEGPRSPMIDLCIATMARHNADFLVADPGFVRAADGGDELWEFAKDLPIPQRSDLMRLFILHRHGGIWTDTDCIQIAPFDFHDRIPDVDLLGVYNPHQTKGFGTGGMLATPWACRPGSPVIERALATCRALLEQIKRGERVPYGQTSVGLLSQAWKQRQAADSIERRQHWRYNRVAWYRARQVFNRVASREHHEGSDAWSPNVVSYHLTNAIAKPQAKHDDSRILHEGRNPLPFFSFALQKSLGLHPAIFGRTKEILARLPTGPRRGVEVGVYRGQNARHLLQQRRDLQMTLVDPWGSVTDQAANYRSTGDYQSRFDVARWQRVYAFVGQTLAFAADRFRRLRMASDAALHHVADGSQDFVFIDANHSYEDVRGDLAWSTKVRPGGFIGGHDYKHPREGNRYGVKRAVDEWAAAIGKPVQTGIDYTWFVRL